MTNQSPERSTDLGPYDHVRANENAPVPAGVYRVVGTGEDGVALLRVADTEEQRVHPGVVERVDRATLEAFEPAENPDAGVSLSDLVEPVVAVGSALRYWLGL